MRMVVRWLGGPIRAGILIAFKDNSLRVAAAGLEDVLELSWRDGVWIDAAGFPVSIDFEPSADAFASARISNRLDEPAPRLADSLSTSAHPPVGAFAPYVN